MNTMISISIIMPMNTMISVIICEKLSWYFKLLVSFLARHATYAAFIMLSFLLDAPPSREELWNNSKLNICHVSFCYKHGAFVGLDGFEIRFSTSDLDLWPFFQIYENQPKMKTQAIALIDVCLGVAIWRWKQDILTKQELLARYIHWADLPNMWFVDSSMSCFFLYFLGWFDISYDLTFSRGLQCLCGLMDLQWSVEASCGTPATCQRVQ